MKKMDTSTRQELHHLLDRLIDQVVEKRQQFKPEFPIGEQAHLTATTELFAGSKYDTLKLTLSEYKPVEDEWLDPL